MAAVPPPPPNADDKAVIQALDARLPKWPGPEAVVRGPPAIQGISGSGWWGEGSPDAGYATGGPSQWLKSMNDVLRAVSSLTDASGHRLATVLDNFPDHLDIPYTSFRPHLSLSLVHADVERKAFRSLRDFDMNMIRLFDKARRYYTEGSDEYGMVITLQRYYNALTGPYPMSPSDTRQVPSNHFASIPAGPGRAKPLSEAAQEQRLGMADEDLGVTTYRVGTKDRTFTEEARHKGQSYRIGKWPLPSPARSKAIHSTSTTVLTYRRLRPPD